MLIGAITLYCDSMEMEDGAKIEFLEAVCWVCICAPASRFHPRRRSPRNPASSGSPVNARRFSHNLFVRRFQFVPKMSRRNPRQLEQNPACNGVFIPYLPTRLV